MTPWSRCFPNCGTSTPVLHNGEEENGKCTVQCHASRCCEHAWNTDSARMQGFLKSPSRPEVGSGVSSRILPLPDT